MKTNSKTKTYQGDSAPAIGSWFIIVAYVAILAYQFLRQDNGLDSTNGILTVYLPRVLFFSAIFIGFAIISGKMFHWEWWHKSKGSKSRSRSKKSLKRK